MSEKRKIVFVCNHNAGKSRMAEAYLAHVAGDRFEVESAGTDPGDEANPQAVEVLAEKGLSLREGPGRQLTDDLASEADLIVTFGCTVGQVPDASKVQDWAMVDANGEPIKDYAAIRDEIFRRIDQLVEDSD